jgi:hypothetical protein
VSADLAPYRQTVREELPPVFLEIPEDVDGRGTGAYLNAGLNAAEASRLTAPAPARPAHRARAEKALIIGSILLTLTAGTVLSIGDGALMDEAAAVAFVLSAAMSTAAGLSTRKYRKALEAWTAAFAQATPLRFIVFRLAALKGGLRAEVLQLGESLAQSREAIMLATMDRHASYPGGGELLAALDLLARYAYNPKPYEQRRAREAIYAFADYADNYVHTGNPYATLGDAKA